MICLLSLLTILVIGYSQSFDPANLDGWWSLWFNGKWQGNFSFNDSNKVSISVPNGDKQYFGKYYIIVSKHDTVFSIQIVDKAAPQYLNYNFEMVNSKEFKLIGTTTYLFEQKKRIWVQNSYNTKQTLKFRKGQHFHE